MDTKTEAKFKALALEQAAKSKCTKRKVGAVIVRLVTSHNDSNHYYKLLSTGWNYNPDDSSCEYVDENNVLKTKDSVIHAEVVAIEAALSAVNGIPPGSILFVTHPPCKNCQEQINKYGLKTIIADGFMKHSEDKLRYDLIPPSALKQVAEVVTFGAKKYKPNNWKNCKDSNEFLAATMRHIEAFRLEEIKDSESGLHHLAHAATNLLFILELLNE